MFFVSSHKRNKIITKSSAQYRLFLSKLKKNMPRFTFLLVVCLCNLGLSISQSQTDSLTRVLAEHQVEDTARVNLLNTIAQSYRQQDLEKTLHYATLADSLATHLHYDKGKVKSLQLIGDFYYRTQDLPRASEWYNRALGMCQAQDDSPGVAYCNNHLGNVNLMLANYDSALFYYHNALDLFETLSDRAAASGVLINIGNIYYMQGNYPETLDYLFRALLVFEELNNRVGISGCYNNIGVIYDEQEKYAKALTYYQKALDIRVELGLNEDIAASYTNIGNIYNYQDAFAKALGYYQKALDIYVELDNLYGKATSYYNIGIAYLGQADLKHAKTCYDTSFALAQKAGIKDLMVSNYVEFAKVYFRQNKFRQAIRDGEKAYELATELGDRINLKEVSDILAQSYAQLGDYKAAYAYHLEFKAQSDTLQNEANTEEMIGLEYQYKFDKAKALADIEQEQTAMAFEAENVRQKTIRNAFILGFMVMLIFVLIISRSLSLNKKAHRKLAAQKFEIERQAGELQIAHNKLLDLSRFKAGLTSMIVHDLKNPLNLIINSAMRLTPERQIQEMKQQGQQMLNLVLNILDVERYEDNVMHIERQNLCLQDLAGRAIEQVAFLAQQKHIVLSNTIDPQLIVRCDGDAIERVFINLLTNAIKYSPNNAVVEVRALPASEKLHSLRVEVQDHGIGIPEEDRDRVFAKFSQVFAKSSGRVHSTGLGLTYCKMAVEAHGGAIGVESVPNDGCIFWFVLEQVEAEINSQDFKPSLVSQPTITLSEADRIYLKPYLEQLKTIEVYKVFEIRKIVRAVDSNKSSALLYWKEELLNAIHTGNGARYCDLINV